MLFLVLLLLVLRRVLAGVALERGHIGCIFVRIQLERTRTNTHERSRPSKYYGSALTACDVFVLVHT